MIAILLLAAFGGIVVHHTTSATDMDPRCDAVNALTAVSNACQNGARMLLMIGMLAAATLVGGIVQKTREYQGGMRRRPNRQEPDPRGPLEELFRRGILNPKPF